MKYTYDIFVESPFKGLSDSTNKDHRIETTTDVNQLTAADVSNRQYVKVYDNENGKEITRLYNIDDLDDWKLGLTTAAERNYAWRTSAKIEDSSVENVRKILNGMKKDAEKNIAEKGKVEKIEDKINPMHYQNYLDDLQWIEAMQKIYKDTPEGFNIALEIMARKYLDRLGKKDIRVQEIKKAIWYLKLLAARTIRKNEFVAVKNIDNILTNG